MPWKILHMCNLSGPPKGSGQGNCRYVHFNNRKGDHDMGKLFLKLRVSFGGLLRSKKVLSESSHRIETHIDAVVEVIEFQGSVAFELYIDEDFIGFW